MSRIDISYGGQWYSIGDRTLAEVHEEIRAGMLAGHLWLQVNDGEGQPRPAFLSITPGVPIAVVPLSDAQDPPTDPQPLDFDDEDDIDHDAGAKWRGPTIHPERRRG